MEWNHAIHNQLFVPLANCSLIIVGQTRTGNPFCFENNFIVQNVTAVNLTVQLEFSGENPFQDLQHITFVEVSLREKGILYYAFADLLELNIERSACSIVLKAPQEVMEYENRRNTRISLREPLPLTCKIVGVRRNSTHQGVTFASKILDLSRGGLTFITSTRIFYPIYLQLSFQIPGYPTRFDLLGEIIRVNPFGGDGYRVAVEFREIPENISNLIDAFCKS